jgi:hypothetical protein
VRKFFIFLFFDLTRSDALVRAGTNIEIQIEEHLKKKPERYLNEKRENSENFVHIVSHGRKFRINV